MKIINLLVIFAFDILNNLQNFILTFTQTTYTYIRDLSIMNNDEREHGREAGEQRNQQQEHQQQQEQQPQGNEVRLEELPDVVRPIGENEEYLLMDMDMAIDSDETSDYEYDNGNYHSDHNDNDDIDDNDGEEETDDDDDGDDDDGDDDDNDDVDEDNDDGDDDDDDEDDDDDDDDDDEDESDSADYIDDDGDFGTAPVDIIGWMDTDGENDTACTLQKFHRYFVKNRTERIYKFKPLHLFKCNHRITNNASEHPMARSGHRVIASESYLYCLGGYNPNIPSSMYRRENCMLLQELWAYNFATKSWTLLLNKQNANMPIELASNALALYNNVLISHGGTGYPFGETCSNDCHVYKVDGRPQVVRLQVAGDFPTAQYGPAIVLHNDYLYTVGGTTGFDYSCDVYRLNLSNQTWENVYICRPGARDDPEGRYRHEVVYDGNYIYVLGGGTSSTVYDLQKLPAFNLNTNLWEYFDTYPDHTGLTEFNNGYPRPRKCFSCVQYKRSDGEIEAFITGGLQGDFMTYFDDIWKLNVRRKQWSKIHSASLPRPLYFHSAAHAVNGCMYIFGGIQYSRKDLRRRNDLYKMWMTIPKLTEICWDAITFYNNNLHRYTSSKLLSVGIPERFVRRLPLKGHIIGQSKHLPGQPE